MKTLAVSKKLSWITLLFSMIFMISVRSFGQEKQDPNQKPPQTQQSLTPEQTATIKKILSKYNPAALTAADAKAIHEQFRQAGIHAGPETKSAITAAGFDPEKLRTLDPPKSPDNSGNPNPPSNDDLMKTLQEKIIKPLGLNTAQSEAVTGAYKDFTAALEKLKKAQTDPRQPVEKSKVEPLVKARDEKISKVLTKDQFTKYMELEKSMRPAKPGETGSKQNQGGK